MADQFKAVIVICIFEWLRVFGFDNGESVLSRLACSVLTLTRNFSRKRVIRATSFPPGSASVTDLEPWESKIGLKTRRQSAETPRAPPEQIFTERGSPDTRRVQNSTQV